MQVVMSILIEYTFDVNPVGCKVKALGHSKRERTVASYMDRIV